jgi:hypothetical protein
MKYFFSTICFGIVISFFDSCKKDSHELIIPTFYEQAAGIWVPYEYLQNGIVLTGPFTSSSVFGVYAESVLLNKDQRFIPIIWINKDTFSFKTADAGNFEYLPGNKLIFKGPVELRFDIIKFEDDDLWLKNFQGQYKLKRQH